MSSSSRMPKGMKLDHGYIQVRLFNHGVMYCKNFGKDSAYAREIASIYLSQKRKEILMGKFGIDTPLPRRKFSEVATSLYLPRWSKEVDENGKPKHNEPGIYRTKGCIDTVLNPYFGKMWYDEIKPKDILNWRTHRVQQVEGTTVNREQNILSSIFSHVEDWIKLEQVKAFCIQEENPCVGVPRASMRKRERVLSEYEISKLKLAFRTLEDENGCENVALALKTCLSLKDLMTLKLGDIVDLDRSKTGVNVLLPITVMHQPSWTNWRRRWNAAIKASGIEDIEFRDLRKSGINLLLGHFDTKLISQYSGHADLKTTEAFYTKIQADKMRPLAEFLNSKVDSL